MDIMQKNLQLSRDFASRPRRSVHVNTYMLSQQDEEEDWADEEASRAGDELLHENLKQIASRSEQAPSDNVTVLLACVLAVALVVGIVAASVAGFSR